ncbi:unnamed protein product [Blepharisma stoltei]|uniref:Uncharacterized protein n=1 Tax=Blepharisma stoltei TaxID=1481888 RepID=A0AAU9J741_9CILI|nr:unnamed protein product [Blepharisma stoltei]
MSDQMSHQERIHELALRMKRLREELKPFYKGKQFRSNEIPDHVKEEICRLYNEHGGIHILMRLCNITYAHIKAWHREWKKNPSCFAENGPQRFTKKLNYIDGVLGGMDDLRTPKLNMTKCTRPKINRKEFKGTSSLNEIRNMLSNDVLDKCEEIRRRMKSNGTDAEIGLENDLKLEIVRIALKVGCVRPVALVLGLSERVISGWKELFIKEIDECPKELFDEVYQ